MSKYVVITGSNFEEAVLKSDKPVLVDFWASWCGPCKMLAPVFEELAEKMDGQAVFAKVNVDEQEQLAMNFKVMSIPTLILFKNGEAVKKSVGVISADDMRKMIEE